ncbi:hypothetical protein SCLCIDRAFT_1207111, partial [Scleroderma citrinum Foug A]
MADVRRTTQSAPSGHPSHLTNTELICCQSPCCITRIEGDQSLVTRHLSSLVAPANLQMGLYYCQCCHATNN